MPLTFEIKALLAYNIYLPNCQICLGCNEIDSFILKYKNLLLAGIDANLTITSYGGKAVLTLAVEVDVSHPQPHHHLRHVGAARLRRRERRAAERAAAADPADATNQAEEANPIEAAEEVVIENGNDSIQEDTTEEVIKKKIKTKRKKVTEEAIEKDEDTENSEEEQLSCDKCAFVGKTLAGLKTHKTKLHKNTPANAKKSMFTMI